MPIDIQNMESVTPSHSSVKQPASHERPTSSQKDCLATPGASEMSAKIKNRSLQSSQFKHINEFDSKNESSGELAPPYAV